MTTIDSYDINIYLNYAKRMQLVEQTNASLGLEHAVSISQQTSTISLYPKMTEMQMLLGVVGIITPWAHFIPPKSYDRRRRSPFAFSCVAPLLGSDEEQRELGDKIDGIEIFTEEQELEKKVLSECFSTLNRLNGMLGFIVGRLGQFLQG